MGWDEENLWRRISGICQNRVKKEKRKGQSFRTLRLHGFGDGRMRFACRWDGMGSAFVCFYCLGVGDSSRSDIYELKGFLGNQ